MPKLVAIQVLRGLAALSIALLHLEPDWRLRGALPEGWTRPFPLEAGVDVFFVISGFVMVYASHALFGRRGAAGAFLMRRIARVVPLYWLTTAIVLAILAARPDLMRSALATPELVLASFAFIPWPRPDGLVQPVYTLGWTLNFEMFFYALFAGTLLVGWSRRASVAGLSLLLTLFVAIGLAAPNLPQPLGFWTWPMQIEFVLGMVLGLARLEGVTLPSVARILLFGLGLGLFWLAGDATVQLGQNAAFAFAVPAACLVAACGLSPGRRAGPDEDHPRERWPTRLGEGLGDASYAIYLLHPFAIRGTLLLTDRLGLAGLLGTAGVTVAALAATVLVGVLSYRLFERPVTRLVRRRIRGNPSAPPAARGGARAPDPG